MEPPCLRLVTHQQVPHQPANTIVRQQSQSLLGGGVRIWLSWSPTHSDDTWTPGWVSLHRAQQRKLALGESPSVGCSDAIHEIGWVIDVLEPRCMSELVRDGTSTGSRRDVHDDTIVRLARVTDAGLMRIFFPQLRLTAPDHFAIDRSFRIDSLNGVHVHADLAVEPIDRHEDLVHFAHRRRRDVDSRTRV